MSSSFCMPPAPGSVAAMCLVVKGLGVGPCAAARSSFGGDARSGIEQRICLSAMSTVESCDIEVAWELEVSGLHRTNVSTLGHSLWPRQA
jgi:hypothetical protein